MEGEGLRDEARGLQGAACGDCPETRPHGGHRTSYILLSRQEARGRGSAEKHSCPMYFRELEENSPEERR